MKHRSLLFGVGIAIGLLTIAQIRSETLPEWSDSFSQAADHAAILSVLSADRTALLARKQNIAAQISAVHAAAPKALAAELLALDARMAKTALSGSGIVLSLRPSADAEADMVAVVNVLRIAQATAIAIDGVRIGFSTPISVEDGLLSLGAAKKQMPELIKITAIGQSDAFLSALGNRVELASLRAAVSRGDALVSAEVVPTLFIPAI